MKKYLLALVFASTISFESEAVFLTCDHAADSPNESWNTFFLASDETSWLNAMLACMRDGGEVTSFL